MKPFAIIEPQYTECKFKNIVIRHVQKIDPVVIIDKSPPIEKFYLEKHVVERVRNVVVREPHVVPVGGLRVGVKEAGAGTDLVINPENDQGNNSITSQLVQSLHQQHHRIPIFLHRHTIPTNQASPNIHISIEATPQSPHHSQLSQNSIKNSIKNKETHIKNIFQDNQQPSFVLHQQAIAESRLMSENNDKSRSSIKDNSIRIQSIRSGKTGKSYKIGHQDQQNIVQPMFVIATGKKSRFNPQLQSQHKQQNLSSRHELQYEQQPRQQNLPVKSSSKLSNKQPTTQQKPIPTNTNTKQIPPTTAPQAKPKQKQKTQPQLNQSQHSINQDQPPHNKNKVPIFSKQNKIYHANIANSGQKESRVSGSSQRYKIFSAEPQRVRTQIEDRQKFRVVSHVNQYVFQNKGPVAQTRRKSVSEISVSQRSNRSEPFIHQFKQHSTIQKQPILQPQPQLQPQPSMQLQPQHQPQPKCQSKPQPQLQLQRDQQPQPKCQSKIQPQSQSQSQLQHQYPLQPQPLPHPTQISQIDPNSNSQHYLQNFDGSFNNRDKSSIFSPVQLSNKDSISSINAISCDQDNSYLIRYNQQSPKKHFKKIVGLGRRSRRIGGEDQQMNRCATEKVTCQEEAQHKAPKILKIKPKAVKKSSQQPSIILNNSAIQSERSQKDSQISIQIVKFRQLKPFKI